MSKMVVDGPVQLDDGWVLVDTDMIAAYVREGRHVLLPTVELADENVRASYSDDELVVLDALGVSPSEIESVELVGEEEVQCIAIDDDEHLYLTNEWVPVHNTSNIVFLKSTDSDMLEKLEKMSGKKHESHIDQKMVSRNEGKVWMRNEGVVSYTMSTTEMPVISYNDMAFIPERNSIVFRAGDSPIWNRNETVLPMSWRLLKANAIRQPGKEYSLQTIPTLSSAIDFDIRKNQPDFHEMLELRMEQACLVDEAEERYRELFDMDEFEITQLDPDVYAAAIMEIVDALYEKNHSSDGSSTPDVGRRKPRTNTSDEIEANDQFMKAAKRVEREMASRKLNRYFNLLSQEDLINPAGAVNHNLDQVFEETFKRAKVGVPRDDRFSLRSDGLYGGAASGLYDGKPFITYASAGELESAERHSRREGSRVYSENEGGHIDEASVGMAVSDDFYRFMASLDRWDDLWDGKFKDAFRRAYVE